MLPSANSVIVAVAWICMDANLARDYYVLICNFYFELHKDTNEDGCFACIKINVCVNLYLQSEFDGIQILELDCSELLLF